ncbi:hypothetical protein HCN44_004216 [Aphidius gifuensis]|uniref:Uncharacterized protein n=1 Tax=Aphidius gifuensis TaxID=684658 RepID=A0A835CT72_APHGI|nr:uncharacterized protein LOC122848474 [Aphidius gifuensis]KAF7994744.1 hypothetical protein HCN44_004216 [Aphidius gifuensis]
MARWFLIAFAITLIVGLAQALPAPQQETSTPAYEIGETWKNLGDKLNQGLETLKNDPNVQNFLKNGQDFFKDGKDFLKDGLTKLQEQTSKLVPKTDDTQKPATQ